MLRSLKLLLPALVPSWRFFDAIAPSPRIEFALLNSLQDAPDQWQEFRPRPERLSFATALRRLLRNPDWNETLFLVSCAERMIGNPTAHCEQEIIERIKADIRPGETTTAYLRFRLAFISRQENGLCKEILFISPAYPFSKDAT